LTKKKVCKKGKNEVGSKRRKNRADKSNRYLLSSQEAAGFQGLRKLSSVVADVSRCRCSSASHHIPYRRSPLSPGIITITIICCPCGVGKRAMTEEECKEMANRNKMQ
jgi:hypothetical protein